MVVRLHWWVSANQPSPVAHWSKSMSWMLTSTRITPLKPNTQTVGEWVTDVWQNKETTVAPHEVRLRISLFFFRIHLHIPKTSLCHIISMEHFPLRPQAYLWFLDFLKVEYKAEKITWQSCGTSFQFLSGDRHFEVKVTFFFLVKFTVRVGSGNPEPCLNYAAIAYGCWGTSHDVPLLHSPLFYSPCVYIPLFQVNNFWLLSSLCFVQLNWIKLLLHILPDHARHSISNVIFN